LIRKIEKGRSRTLWLDSGTAWILDLLLHVARDKSQGIIKVQLRRDDFDIVLFCIHWSICACLQLFRYKTVWQRCCSCTVFLQHRMQLWVDQTPWLCCCFL